MPMNFMQRPTDRFAVDGSGVAVVVIAHVIFFRRRRNWSMDENADRRHHGQSQHDVIIRPRNGSLRSRSSSFSVVSKQSSNARRCASIFASASLFVPLGAHVVKKARSPSTIVRRIRSKRVQTWPRSADAYSPRARSASLTVASMEAREIQRPEPHQGDSGSQKPSEYATVVLGVRAIARTLASTSWIKASLTKRRAHIAPGSGRLRPGNLHMDGVSRFPYSCGEI